MEHPPYASLKQPPVTGPHHPSKPQDWENYKSEIEELYGRSELREVMQYMEQTYNFKATIKQWKTQLKKWNFKKRIESYEYKAILKKKKQREEERPGVASEFLLRGTVVPYAKIARYRNEGRKKGLIKDDDSFSHITTPPSLSCRTPPNVTLANSPSWVDVVESPGPNPSGALALQYQDRESSEQASPISRLSTISPIELNSPGHVHHSRRRPVTPLFRTPPLRPFDWWQSFGDFNNSLSPALLNGPSSKPIWQLLASFGQRINNYEYERVFHDILIQSHPSILCPDCEVLRILKTAVGILVHEENLRKSESFIRATIQYMSKWNEISDGTLVIIASMVGSALCQLQRYKEALPLLTEAAKGAEKHISSYRPSSDIALAACYVGLDQLEDAQEQLKKTFGPEYGRLAILAAAPGPPRRCCKCMSISPNQVNIQGKPVETSKHAWLESLAPRLMESEFGEIEIPAGTFCLPSEIKAKPNFDEASNFYSVLFFSTVTLSYGHVLLMQRGGEIVRELHRRSHGRCRGFSLEWPLVGGSPITDIGEQLTAG